MRWLLVPLALCGCGLSRAEVAERNDCRLEAWKEQGEKARTLCPTHIPWDECEHAGALTLEHSHMLEECDQ